MIGTQFGPYRIDEKLGQGGMGVVYKGYDTTLHRPVAIKTIVAAHKDALGSSSEARFMREARAAGRLQHPAVVAIYHFGVEADTQYIVMEYVEGKSLRKVIHDEPLPLDQLYDIGIQTADALAAAHEANIIHRDMKADNIMVTVRGQVKILDFGLAKLKDPVGEGGEQTVFVTQPGIALGTVSHMSPEQAMGKEVDGKTDVFALGVVLYHMASGKLPFEGANATVTMLKILEGEPDPVRQHNPYLPEALQELIHRCLRKRSGERPTASEVADSLKALRAGNAPAVLAAAAAAAAHAPATPWTPTLPKEPSPVPGTVLVAAPPAVAVAAPPVLPAGSVAVSATPRAVPLSKPRGKGIYWTVRGLRIGISVLLIAQAVAMVAHFVFAGEPTVRHAVPAGIVEFVKSLATPLQTMLHGLLPWNLTSGRWDFMCLAAAVALLVVNGFLAAALWNIQDRLYRRRGVQP